MVDVDLGRRVMVTVSNLDNNSACKFLNVDFHSDSVNNGFVNNLDRRAVKVAEGAAFHLDCRSSFEAEPVGISQFSMHVGALITNGSLPMPSFKRGKDD